MRLIHKEWDRFCASVDAGRCVTISELPDLSSETNWLAIKHDVETNVERALQIAKIEAKHGIAATFFIQSYLLKGNEKLLKEIAELGHEVTYHYDVLDANNGDFELATEEFSKTVDKFENLGFPVTSVCPHGNPMMNRVGWNSNKDFFRNTSVATKFIGIFDLVVQGKEKIKRDYTYISDAGYGFKIISDIVGNDQVPSQDVSLSSIDELMERTASSQAMVISTHPHRWSQSSISAGLAKARFFAIRKVAMTASRFILLKRIMSKFYFLAKKI